MRIRGLKHSFWILAVLAMPGQVSAQPDQWLTANGDAGAQKYSPANQISPQNVRRLKRAWTVHTGDVSRGREDGTSYHTAWSSTPLFVNNMLYVSTPTSKVFSVQPDTGKVDWIYDAHPDLAYAGIVKSRVLASRARRSSMLALRTPNCTRSMPTQESRAGLLARVARWTSINGIRSTPAFRF